LEIAEFEGDKDTQKTALLHLITNEVVPEFRTAI